MPCSKNLEQATLKANELLSAQTAARRKCEASTRYGFWGPRWSYPTRRRQTNWLLVLTPEEIVRGLTGDKATRGGSECGSFLLY